MNATIKQILDGVALILKYELDAGFEANHDILYFGSYDTREKMTLEEQAQMDEWGWMEKYDCWGHYT